MDYREKAKLNQNTAMKIKHMAFAVNSVDKSLRNFQSFLNVSQKTEKVIWEKAKTKVAVFFVNPLPEKRSYLFSNLILGHLLIDQDYF